MAKKLIPRVIHTCWFGNNPKPKIIQECYDSWKKHMPTWEIKEWNEQNFDLSQNKFAEVAFRRKKYAFVTDYVRLKVLYDEGGVYCDSDYLAVKPWDRLLESKAFTGHETSDLMVTAIMGAVEGHSWIEHLLSYYNNRPFSEAVNTNIITEMSRPLIVRENKYGYRFLKDDVTIYPVSHLCSFDHRNLKIIPHPDAYGYHLFQGSWLGRVKV